MIIIYKFLLILYNFIFYIIAMTAIFRLLIKSNREKIQDRLLLSKRIKQDKKYIWIHGASVGEVLSAKSLVFLLLKKYGNKIQILITSHTETSKHIVESVFNHNQVEHHYLPYDCNFLVNKFIKKYNPSAVFWLEQDFFLIFLSKINKQKIPLILLNARISDISFKRWKKVKIIISNILKYFDAIYPMSTFNKQKIDFLNKKDNKFIGNLKYSNILSKEEILTSFEKESKKIKSYFNNYNIISMLSIHQGEEDIVLNLYKNIKQQNIKTKIIVIPRHINKIKYMEYFFKKNNIKITLYSEVQNLSALEDVILIDSMGKTNFLCYISDITFIGKSLYMLGGHNLLEPLSVGCPVIFGKNMGNFKDIVQDTLKNNAGLEVLNEKQLSDKILYLLKNKTALEELKNNTLFVQKEGSYIIKNLEREIDCYLKI